MVIDHSLSPFSSSLWGGGGFCRNSGGHAPPSFLLDPRCVGGDSIGGHVSPLKSTLLVRVITWIVRGCLPCFAGTAPTKGAVRRGVVLTKGTAPG